MQHRLLTGSTGVEITDIGLGSATDDDIEEIRRLVAEFCVAVFPEQHLEPAAQVAFAKRLGPLLWTPGEEPHPEFPDILQFANEGKAAHRTGVFHTDTCFIAEPPSFTMLSAVVSPAHGGDTLFSNQYLAYDALSPAWRDLLDQRRVRHIPSGVANPDEVPTEPVWHPAVRRHPVSGRLALYTTMPARNVEIEGMTEEESSLIISFLYDQAHGIDRIYRHRWSTGDLVMWDNRCTQHAAVHDHGDQTRIMNRVMVAGEIPIRGES